MASVNESYLLTIAIPTYNRASYLKKALSSIGSEIGVDSRLIELLISDNCSNDNTFDVVREAQESGLAIRYIKNERNLGVDFNIAQCYTAAKGRFVLAFGDDDIFLPGAIDKIISVLQTYENLGVLYLNWTLDNQKALTSVGMSKLLMFDDYEEFLKHVSHNITFISGNIVNAQYVKQIKFDDYNHTNLVQLPLLLTAVMEANINLAFVTPLVAVPLDNSGGYSLCNVFGKNINQIFERFVRDPKSTRTFKNINVKLLSECFPGWIKRLRTQNHNFNEDDILGSLNPVFGQYIQYYLFPYILIIIPRNSVNLVWPIFRTYSFLLRRGLAIFNRKPQSVIINLNTT